jgi:hypothetical protein
MTRLPSIQSPAVVVVGGVNSGVTSDELGVTRAASGPTAAVSPPHAGDDEQQLLSAAHLLTLEVEEKWILSHTVAFQLHRAARYLGLSLEEIYDVMPPSTTTPPVGVSDKGGSMMLRLSTIDGSCTAYLSQSDLDAARISSLCTPRKIQELRRDVSTATVALSQARSALACATSSLSASSSFLPDENAGLASYPHPMQYRFPNFPPSAPLLTSSSSTSESIAHHHHDNHLAFIMALLCSSSSAAGDATSLSYPYAIPRLVRRASQISALSQKILSCLVQRCTGPLRIGRPHHHHNQVADPLIAAMIDHAQATHPLSLASTTISEALGQERDAHMQQSATPVRHQILAPSHQTPLLNAVREALQPALAPVQQSIVPPVVREALQPALVPVQQSIVPPVVREVLQPALAPVQQSIVPPVVREALQPALAPVQQSIVPPVVREALQPALAPVQHSSTGKAVDGVEEAERDGKRLSTNVLLGGGSEVAGAPSNVSVREVGGGRAGHDVFNVDNDYIDKAVGLYAHAAVLTQEEMLGVAVERTQLKARAVECFFAAGVLPLSIRERLAEKVSQGVLQSLALNEVHPAPIAPAAPAAAAASSTKMFLVGIEDGATPLAALAISKLTSAVCAAMPKAKVVCVTATTTSAVEALVRRGVDAWQCATCLSPPQPGPLDNRMDRIVIVFTTGTGFQQIPMHIRTQLDLAVLVVNQPLAARGASLADSSAVPGIPGGASQLVKEKMQEVVCSAPRGRHTLRDSDGGGGALGCPVLFAVDPRIRSDDLERWCTQQSNWIISNKDGVKSAATARTSPNHETLPSTDF